MNNKELIAEIGNIKEDFKSNKISFKEVDIQLHLLSESESKDYSLLYNLFFTSQPENYLTIN